MLWEGGKHTSSSAVIDADIIQAIILIEFHVTNA